MPPTWTTVQQAADRLGVSTRTIERRIQTGTIESRLTPQGGRQVLADTEPTVADIHTDTVSVIEKHADRELQVAGTALGMAKEQADAARRDLRSARHWGRLGWGLFILTIVGAGTAAYLLGRDLERVQGQLHVAIAGAERGAALERAAAAEVARAVVEVDQLHGDLRRARQDLQDAHVAAAEALMALVAASTPTLRQTAISPNGIKSTTQPTSRITKSPTTAPTTRPGEL